MSDVETEQHRAREMSRRVYERVSAYRAQQHGRRPDGWRIEVGPEFEHYLRRTPQLEQVAGFVEVGVRDSLRAGLALWGVPLLRVEGPEGWRLLEA